MSVVRQSVPGVCVGVWSEFTQTVYRYHHFVSWVNLDFLSPIVWSVSWPVCQSALGTFVLLCLSDLDHHHFCVLVAFDLPGLDCLLVSYDQYSARL